jgi:hypothetical protein
MTLAFIVMAIHVWCNVAATVFSEYCMRERERERERESRKENHVKKQMYD